MSDAINPDHYKRLPVEAIEIIKAAIDGAPSNQDAYLHGQVLKYVLRCWNKNGIEDLKKAKWYLDRLIGSLESDEQQKAADLQSLKNHPFGKLRQPAWTPKIGDWVRIKKPAETRSDGVVWFEMMDEHDGKILQVEKIEYGAIVHDNLGFLFDWLEPAEQPKAPLNSDTIPEGYRKLNDSSEEPRQLGDLRWSVAEKRYIEISVDEIGYANRDNWAACRKVEPGIKQSLTTEPPDGWRWIEVGETLRSGDTTNTIDEIPEDWIGIKCAVKHKLLRRNRYEVGEKVIGGLDGFEFVVVGKHSRFNDVYVVRNKITGTIRNILDRLLAPYIEETK